MGDFSASKKADEVERRSEKGAQAMLHRRSSVAAEQRAEGDGQGRVGEERLEEGRAGGRGEGGAEGRAECGGGGVRSPMRRCEGTNRASIERAQERVLKIVAVAEKEWTHSKARGSV